MRQNRERRRTGNKKGRNKGRKSRKNLSRRRRGGAALMNGVYPPEPASQIQNKNQNGGGDPRYTFNQPLANMIESGKHSFTSVFNDFMGRSHSVSPSVLNQPYLR